MLAYDGQLGQIESDPCDKSTYIGPIHSRTLLGRPGGNEPHLCTDRLYGEALFR